MSDGPWPPQLQWPSDPLTDGVVVLDKLTDADTDRVVAGCSDPATQQWLPMPSPYGPAEASAFMRGRTDAAASGEELTCAFRGADDRLLAGVIGLSQRGYRGEAALGYWTVPDRRGRGWTARAVVLLARYAFASWSPRRIEIIIAPGNHHSAAVAAAAGATREGVRRNGMPDGSGDAIIFSLLAADVAASDGTPRGAEASDRA
jgi:RimJ/RimL family protein N-acetyltransferase